MKLRITSIMFLMNYIFTLFYMSCLFRMQPEAETVLPLFLVTFILMDITYLDSCNLRCNRVITMFLGLMALDCWYMLLIADTGKTGNILFQILSPVIWYASILFVLMFLFQGKRYRFQKAAGCILTAGCIAPLLGLYVSERSFFCMYGLQLLISSACFFFLIIYHRRQVIFVFKSQGKCFALSALIVSILFLAYYFATKEVKNHIANFGIYLPVLLFFLSIHGIAYKEHNSIPLSTVFDKKQAKMILFFSLTLLLALVSFSGIGYHGLVLSVNFMAAIFYVCNIVWEWGLKTGENKIEKESRYHAALEQFLQEELLKSEFADFLHDEILQDLLSIKYLMGKASRPEIQNLVNQTLDNLNSHIRAEMQNYHPVIRDKLTLRENYQNLMESVALSFPGRTVQCRFDCSDSLFLAKPYDRMVYRQLKELLTNVYKHSAGDKVFISLAQKKGVITLKISDNGTGEKNCGISHEKKQGGIASIKEQVQKMEGSLKITAAPDNFCVEILIPMKGDVSYQYFIS